MDTVRIRSTNEPEWYGERMSGSALNSSEGSNITELEDDSFDDSNYDHSKDLRSLMDDKLEFDETPRKRQRISTPVSPEIELNFDFNEQFQSIDNATMPPKENDTASGIPDSSLKKEINGDSVKLDDRLLAQMYKNSVEILARITVIEKSIQKNQFSTKSGQAKMCEIDLKHKTDQFAIFMKSNGLPLTTAAHMETFESNLKDEPFKLNAVSILKCNILHHPFLIKLCIQ